MLASTIFGWQIQYVVLGILVVFRVVMMPAIKWFRKSL